MCESAYIKDTFSDWAFLNFILEGKNQLVYLYGL